jgi:outer membrane protein
MAFADFLLIYHSYYKTKLADEQLKKEGEEFQEKINADRDKMTALEEKVDSGILSEKEKESLNKEIGEIRMQITKNIQEFNAKIDNERKQEIDKLIEDLRAKLSNYGREKGYTMILDKNELIFSDPRLDLTKEIVDYINKDDK